ncbi:MAG: PVC-type heme-binding CxxCH protein [Planctomycetaceae bacterium]
MLPEGEPFFFTPPGFMEEGKVRFAQGRETGRLHIVVRERETGQPAPCRIAVVGGDGNFYQPSENRLTKYSLSGEWPSTISARLPEAGEWGNRRDKAPYRYLGRFFYSTGEVTVAVPAGAVRVEVSKGFEFRPERVSTELTAGQTREIEVRLKRAAPMAVEGYFGGDPHLHFQRASERDDEIILDLLDAEDIWFGTSLAANMPAGSYSGSMHTMVFQQFRGLGIEAIASRGNINVLSGQEYRSNHYGHLNLFLRDRLIFDQQALDADDGPVFGHLASETRSQGGISIHAHGGYGQEIYADAALGTVDAVELLQFGVYRDIGLAGWYAMLNSGYRFPCVGGSDYPCCRFLGDCRTYVSSDRRDEGAPVEKAKPPGFADWLRGAVEGRSFVTTGPLLLLEVDGKRPGETIRRESIEPFTPTVRLRVRCEVTPVTTVDLIVNGEVQKSFDVPADRRQGEWYVVEHQITCRSSCWIAARAWSHTPGGQPDAESHTNPVFVYLNGRKPYDEKSLDAWLERIEGQIAVHAKRVFSRKTETLAYFQRARDVLMKIRERQGLASDEDPARLALSDASDTELKTVGIGATDDPSAKDVSVSDELVADAARPDPSDEELREFLKPIPPKTPAEAAKMVETVAGFELQLVAAEPLVCDPVAAAFDEDGDLYVCEMRDYPYKPAEGGRPLGTVRLLRDTNGDGVFDEAHVFADKLLWAAGVVPWKGGVFVAAAPDIWYLKDTDGDFRADVKRRVYTGFGTQGQQYMVNNLQFGADHWVYGSTAGNGGMIQSEERPGAPGVSVNGRDFRFDPMGGRFEAITGTVQFGNSFDDWGNRFVCSESEPVQHVVFPDRYLARNPFLPFPSGIQNVAPGPVPIFRISPVERWRQIRSSRRIASNERPVSSPGASHHVVDAAAGVTVYRGGAYPGDLRGQVFVCDGQNNLVHRRALVPRGVTFQSHRVDDRTEFVRSTDTWFRPVNLMNAPDGTLYCLDMSREVLESVHIPLDVAKHLNLTSGRDYGRVYRIAPADFRVPEPPRLSKATTAELVATLESPHGWWRDTAHRLLYERQDISAVPALRTLASESRLAEARLLALWSLDGLKALGNDVLKKALHDPHPSVRENAVRIAEPRLKSEPDLVAEICALADDESQRVRYQTAFSLGETDDSRALSALAGIARCDGDDNWISTAVLSSVAESADRLLGQLVGAFPRMTPPPDLLIIRQLAHLVGARNRSDEVERLLEAIATSAVNHDTALTDRLLAELGHGLKRTGGRLAPHEADTSGSRLLKQALARNERTAKDAQCEIEKRVAAISLLSGAPNEEHRVLLAELLQPGQPEQVQVAAVRALADDPSPSVPGLIVTRWSEFLPLVRRTALEALLSREDGAIALLTAGSRDELTLVDVDPARRTLLLNHKTQAIRVLATQLLGDATPRSRNAVVKEYQAALALNGMAAAGRTVFEKNCTACHQLSGVGLAIGPNLASSPSRDPAALLSHILDPNQYVAPEYLEYIVVDRNGRTHSGLLARQMTTSITLQKQNGEALTILRGQIEELASTNRSLMPEGLERQIPLQAMADLLAYLRDAGAGSQSDRRAQRDAGTLPGLIEPGK